MSNTGELNLIVVSYVVQYEDKRVSAVGSTRLGDQMFF